MDMVSNDGKERSFGLRPRKCYKCRVELVNERGIHMGMSFARHPTNPTALVCSPCYDDLMVNPDTKVQRVGEEVV